MKILVLFGIISFIFLSACIQSTNLNSNYVNCDRDTQCFFGKIPDCASVSGRIYDQDSTKYGINLSFNITEKTTAECLVNFKATRVGSIQPEPNEDPFSIVVGYRQVEGKEMQCRIPLDIPQTNDNLLLKNILPYCNGPLKDALMKS